MQGNPPAVVLHQPIDDFIGADLQVQQFFRPDLSGPRARPGKIWSEELLNLKIGTYEIVDGLVEYDGRRIPLHLKGEHLRAQMTYEAGGPSYRGQVSSDGLQVTAEGYGPIETSMNCL